MGESQQRAISDQYTVGAEEMACVILFEGTGANNNAESEFGRLVSIVSRNHLTVPQNSQKHAVGHYPGVASNNTGPINWHKTLWNTNWHKRVDSAFEVVKGHYAATKQTQVILIGFSRGACNAIMLAWKMQHDQELRNLQVNIFAHDPIPGGTTDFDNANYPYNFQHLPANVTRYWTILYEGSSKAMPERMWQPIIPTGGNHRKVVYLPGSHTKRDINHSIIRKDLMERFLKKSGISIHLNKSSNVLPVDHLLIDSYSGIDLYAYRHKSAQTTFRRRVLGANANVYRDHLFYVNSDHFKLIEKNYPQLKNELDKLKPDLNKSIDIEDSTFVNDLYRSELTMTKSLLFWEEIDFSPDLTNFRFFEFPTGIIPGNMKFEEYYKEYKCKTIFVTKIQASHKTEIFQLLKTEVEKALKSNPERIKEPSEISEAQFREVTWVRVGGRKEQIKCIDEMLRLYEMNVTTPNQKERLIAAIALQLKIHLQTKPMSDRKPGVLGFAIKLLARNNILVVSNHRQVSGKKEIGNSSGKPDTPKFGRL